MPSGGDLLHYQRFHTKISGSVIVATGDTADVTLVAARASYTQFIQQITVTFSVSTANHLTFNDSNGTARYVAATDDSPSVNTEYIFPFGARGMPLTEAKAFMMRISGAGNAAHVEWEGYMKPTAAIDSTAGAASQ